MTGIHKISSQVIDYAERLSAVADAAHGKHHPRGKAARWLLLPASGAALYAVVRSEAFSRQAKEVAGEAKTRASELPDDLIALVRQTTERSGRNGGGGSRPAATRRKTSAARSTRSSSARKAKSAAR